MILISRDFVRGQGLRDVWASDATLVVRARVQRRLDLRRYLCGRVVQRRLYHGRYLRERGFRDILISIPHGVTPLLLTLPILFPFQ
ncbi:hypothetical protein IGI04_001963, partial [Brassica rapa subsp. trilocularis]